MAFLHLIETILAVVVVYILRAQIKKRGRRLLPPGPPGFPLIGNLLSYPKAREQETFMQWSKEYGDLMYAKVLNREFIILNSREAAFDLFEKRSTNYSGRAERVMLKELMPWEWNFGFMTYGDRWRKHRKAFHLGFHPQALKPFLPAHELAMRTLMKTLLANPSMGGIDAKQLCHFYTSIVLLDVVYGYIVKDKDDEIVALCEDAMDAMIPILNTTFAVDLIPWLKYIPSWFPFAKFKRDAKVWGRSVLAMRDQPFEWTRTSGTARHSMVREAISRIETDGASDNGAKIEEELTTLKGSAAMGYAAGVDTMKAEMRALVLALLLNPEVQKKAQAELDSVLGDAGTRLPTLEDKEHLPYIQAIISEVLRWRPAIPAGVPHASMHDDVYRGYHIPANSIIIGNVWAILHDEKEYPNPEMFDPERFMPRPGQKKPMDPNVAVFGFGRRICPGRYLALDMLFFAATSILSAFTILPGLDEKGEPIIPSDRFLDGAVIHPEAYPCRFEPRSHKAVEFISNFDTVSDEL